MEAFQVDGEARLVPFLRSRLPGWKRTTIEQRVQAGTVLVNGRAVRRNEVLAVGDVVEVGDACDRAARARPPQGIALLFDDEDLLAIDKPPGLLAVGNDSERQRTAMALMSQFLATRERERDVPLWPVHRIDRETSGVLLFAKSREAQAHVQRRWDAARKTYLALVDGVPDPASGTIDQPLFEDRALFVRVGRREGAQQARTHFTTLERRERGALLAVELETGRRQQIRAHLSWLGHPVVGDPRYGVKGARFGLHAWRLSVEHPRTAKEIEFVAPPPKWFGFEQRRSP